MQIDQENKHTMSLPHLSGPEKDAIMKEKYLASMKPVSVDWTSSASYTNIIYEVLGI
jgi:pectin methylesterase-like acyl-CoA thioesterase